MLKKNAVAFAVIVSVVLGYATTKPNSFRVERKVVIKASAEKIFPYLEDPKKTLEWSPWEKKDPNSKKTFSGAAKGVGAVYEWSGNREIGSGRLEIKEVVASKKVVMDLHFLTPMEGSSVATYTVASAAGSGESEVAWSIEGPMPFLSKLVSVFMDCDKMIATEFDKGLGELKAVVEK